MTIEELKALFARGFEKKRSLLIDQEHQMNSHLLAPSYMVYSHAALSILLMKMSAYDDNDPDEKALKHRVRYVVEQNGSMWFAIEGRPGQVIPRSSSGKERSTQKEYIPAHSDMTSQKCIAAGSVWFSPDYDFITKITNESGHLHPKAETLVWAVAALLNLNANFADEVTLECTITSCHQHVRLESMRLPRAALNQLLPEGCHVSSNHDYNIRVYSNDKWVSFDQSTPPKIDAPSPLSYGYPTHQEEDDDDDGFDCDLLLPLQHKKMTSSLSASSNTSSSSGDTVSVHSFFIPSSESSSSILSPTPLKASSLFTKRKRADNNSDLPSTKTPESSSMSSGPSSSASTFFAPPLPEATVRCGTPVQLYSPPPSPNRTPSPS